MTQTFTAIIHREDDLYVADCPEVGTASQGKTIEEAVANLKEATELYLEEFPLPEINRPAGGRVTQAIRDHDPGCHYRCHSGTSSAALIHS
jgi:predicted RNase H-like HicB family nuclease